MESFTGSLKYFNNLLVEQVKQATKTHKKLTQDQIKDKFFGNGDLFNSTWLKARNKAEKLGRPLSDQEVARIAYCVGIQGYRPHLAMFRSSEYSMEDLEQGLQGDLGFPHWVDPDLEEEEESPDIKKIREILGLREVLLLASLTTFGIEQNKD